MSQQILNALLVWLSLIVAEILHGVLRAIFLVPLVGEFRSDQIGVFSGSLIVIAIAATTVRWIGCHTNRELLITGLLWVVLTVAFEFLFGLLVVQMTVDELTASYRIEQGGLMPLGLLIMLFSPLIATKLLNEFSNH